MKTAHLSIFLLASVATASSPSRAAAYGPDAFTRGNVPVVGARSAVPAEHADGVVRIRYVCRGPVSLAGANILSYDAQGKVIKRQFLWPSVKLPDPSLWNRPQSHLYTLPAGAVAPSAVRVEMRYDLTPVRAFSPEPPAFEILSDAIEWRQAPRSVTPGNWFTLGEDVVFRAALPPGKTGLRISVTDADGRVAFAGDVAGGEWRWRPSEVGFYTARFAWLDASGAAEPIVESFAASQHKTERGAIVLKREAEFPRDAQCFAVSPTPPRAPEDAPPLFGFNVSPSGPGVQFDLVRLLGMSAFIRYHYFRWDKIEAKARGQYDWSQVDYALEMARNRGYGLGRILINPFGTPAWLTTAPRGPAKSWSDRPHLYAPRDMAPWHDFIKAFVTRYPELKYIELWNEPHLPGYSIFWQKSSPQQFVDLMKAGYTGAKEAREGVTVLMGGQGMRYQPFYEEYVKLGGVKWFDQIDTHCGYNMQHFRETERRLGAESKPYWEGEWHTVLYNCSARERPDEETCAYRMLTNMADLMHEDYARLTGFGLTCGEHTPESAAFFAKSEGIHQVLGLFRSQPYLEPRLAALALRVATDRFAGPIARRGAWAFGDDGNERLAAFSSDRGTMAFVWNANAGMKPGGWSKSLKAVLAGSRLLDWTGRAVSLAETKPLRVYFALEPDLAAAAKGGVALAHLDYTAYNYTAPRQIIRGVYTADGEPRENALAGGDGFSARLTADGLRLAVRARGLERLRFAVDAVGKGQLGDVLEFETRPDGALQKTRTPELMGDIPSAFSPAGVPLTASHVEKETDCWTLTVSAGDLYPYVFAPGRTLPFSLVAVSSQGERKWGGGLGQFIKASEFGRLAPSGGGRHLAAMADWNVTPEPSCGWSAWRRVVPGSLVRLTGEIRGRGRIFVAAWLANAQGHSLGRLEATGADGRAGLTTTETWKPFKMIWELPPDATQGNFRIFSWQEPKGSFEVRDLTLVNE